MVKNGKLGQKFNYGVGYPLVLSKAEAFKRALYTQMSHGVVARLYKKEVFQNIRFPQGLHEDTSLLGEFINFNREMVFGQKVCYFYAVNPDSIVHSSSLSRLNDLINATRRLTDLAVMCDKSLMNAAVGKEIHSKLSVLSLIDTRTKENKKVAYSLKKDILSKRFLVLKDSNNLKRDKIAILLLSLGGIPLFKFVFGFYRRFMRNE